MKKLLALGLTLGVLGLVLPAAAQDKAKAKEALQALQDFVGEWKGSGGPDKAKPAPKDPIWSEKISWGWSFKGDEPKLVMDVKDGKVLKRAELTYDAGKKKYLLAAEMADGKKAVFEGELKNEVLTLDRTDPELKEVQRFVMNGAAEGVRFIYRYQHKPDGTTVFQKDFMVASTREGVVLGPKEKKNECVVSGGLGTTVVTHKGETFYVCCSGCLEAFKESPEKYIAEYKAKKAKMK